MHNIYAQNSEKSEITSYKWLEFNEIYAYIYERQTNLRNTYNKEEIKI
jgi:hypothetical protein